MVTMTSCVECGAVVPEGRNKYCSMACYKRSHSGSGRRKPKTKECPSCRRSFTFVIGIGSYRLLCGDKACKRDWLKRKYATRLSTAPDCAAPGCKKKAARPSFGMCEACYSRF